MKENVKENEKEEENSQQDDTGPSTPATNIDSQTKAAPAVETKAALAHDTIEVKMWESGADSMVRVRGSPGVIDQDFAERLLAFVRQDRANVDIHVIDEVTTRDYMIPKQG